MISVLLLLAMFILCVYLEVKLYMMNKQAESDRRIKMELEELLQELIEETGNYDPHGEFMEYLDQEEKDA